MLVKAHPFEVALQDELVDLLSGRGLRKPCLTEIVEETIYRVAHSVNVFLPLSALPTLQGIRFEKGFNISGANVLAGSIFFAAQMTVQAG
jgi:hypothetical protein